MRKIYCGLLLLFISLFAFTKVEAISFNLSIIGDTEVKVGESINLSADYWIGNEMFDPSLPNGGIGPVSHENVTTSSTWSSSKTNIATVNASGVVTGVAVGTTTIKVVYTNDGITTEAEMDINVIEGNSSQNRRLIIDDKYEVPGPILVAGQSRGTFVTLVGIPASKKSDIQATSSNTEVVEITNTNLFNDTDYSVDNVIFVEYNLKKVGTAVLTVSVEYEGETYEDSYTMNVREHSYSLTITDRNGEELPSEVNINDNILLKVTKYQGTLLPEDITNEVIWSSSDENIASVSGGRVTFKKAGNVSISATAIYSNEQVTKTYKFTVLGDEQNNDSKPTNEDEPNNEPQKNINPLCTINDEGIYYDNKGTEVDADTYKKRCGCILIGETYYDIDGKATTEEEFNKVCVPKTGNTISLVILTSLLLILTGIYTIYSVYNNKFYKV